MDFVWGSGRKGGARQEKIYEAVGRLEKSIEDAVWAARGVRSGAARGVRSGAD